jgi:hypothetical protein
VHHLGVQSAVHASKDPCIPEFWRTLSSGFQVVVASTTGICLREFLAHVAGTVQPRNFGFRNVQGGWSRVGGRRGSLGIANFCSRCSRTEWRVLDLNP